jgi:serine/threonine protein kinase
VQERADYELLEVIGEGGMGVVYAARQASIDRTVAIKMLHAEITDDQEQRIKFLSEAVVTGELEHPNIVPIYDLGSNDDGALFYCMKRVKGTPWSNILKSKSERENLDILMKTADAIAFAHSRGVVHRDIKPENVMLGDFGEVIVLDWGIALPVEEKRKTALSSTSGMGGTPAYMAPEMATGPLGRIGIRSDVYLLGAVLFEIITGLPPHPGRDAMKCIRNAAANVIHPVKEGSSSKLMDIALKALSTTPHDRYANVLEFQQAIREYLSHAESIHVASRAQEHLTKAMESGDYEDYAQAQFGYRQALEMWSDNRAAEITP